MCYTNTPFSTILAQKQTFLTNFHVKVLELCNTKISKQFYAHFDQFMLIYNEFLKCLSLTTMMRFTNISQHFTHIICSSHSYKPIFFAISTNRSTTFLSITRDDSPPLIKYQSSFTPSLHSIIA